MGCNCKRNLEEIDRKYGDNGGIIEKTISPISKIIQVIAQFGFGLICGAIVLVVFIPILIFIIISMMLGKDIKIKNPQNLFKKHEK